MPFFVDRYRGPDVSTFFSFLLEERRVIWNYDVDINGVFFKNWLVLFLQIVFLKIESQVVVLDGDGHRAENFIWVIHPSVFFLNQVTSNFDCSKIQLESFIRLTEVRHDNEWAA